MREQIKNLSVLQILGYDYRSNTYFNPSTKLVSFGSLNEAITYCNTHSNCNGIENFRCDGDDYFATAGPPKTSNQGHCSWVMKLKS